MSSPRSIKAPGVEIREHDLSGYTTTNIGTGCLVTGFAQKGEDLEPIQITNRSSWLLNFGAPTNEAEEYFYNAGMEVLNQGGFLYAAKIPYSNDIAGIYAAAKYKINANRGLYNLDEEAGLYYEDELDKDGERVYLEKEEDQPGNANGRFYKNYRSLKEMGLNSLSLIAPAGQDFISKDLVDEYETGESKPGSNVIYLVDKTRAVYTRATEVEDKQDNRDSRYCIGIVPVITTMCNTAYFQNKTTGVKADVEELYQPVRSLKTITFPAGAASAAEYHPTKFTDSDLHTPLMKRANTFTTSLSERAATIAQSCLVNANLVDGKFKPFVCNDVCVVVFKAFVSTEDGKIDFEPVETWVGSLDPNGRNEKGLTTFIDTIINNNSEYIYCFSNLENPQQILNPDHGFVAGSDSDYETVKEDIENDREYQAATLFSAYAAKMLGFGDKVTYDDYSLPAPRDDYFQLETDENGELSKIATATMGALRQFYNEDAKQPVCKVDQLVYGAKLDTEKIGKELAPSGLADTFLDLDGYISISEKYVTELPTVKYRISKKATYKDINGIVDENKSDKSDSKGKVVFYWQDKKDDEDYTYEAYEYELRMGKVLDSDGTETDDEDLSDFLSPDITTMKLSELTILNSTDYLRAIYDFESLVDGEKLREDGIAPGFEDTEDYYNDEEWAGVRQKCIQALIVNSIEKSGRFKAKLRYLKKAKINLDRLDDAFTASQDNSSDNKKMEAKKIG